MTRSFNFQETPLVIVIMMKTGVSSFTSVNKRVGRNFELEKNLVSTVDEPVERMPEGHT